MSDIPGPEQPVIVFAEECECGTQCEENQDSVLHVRIALGELLIVAGGIGGDAGGATASRMAVEHFYAHMAALPEDYPPDNALREAAARANAKIAEAARRPGSLHPRMASTVVVTLMQQDATGSCAWIGHIGDSRAYLVRAGRLHRLTTDHSAMQALLDRNLITQEEAADHPDAAGLTRSLGDQPKVEIDLDQLPLAVDDTLLLCSGGLWKFVSEQEIQRNISAPELTLGTAAHNLLGRALAASGHDSIGIEMARLVVPPDITPARNQSYHPGAKWVLAAFLLAIVGLCALAFFSFF
jgi:protein phosphatase